MTALHVSQLGDGPDLVLLHGWGSSSKIWRTCADKLSSKFRVWCIDLPGHGNSHAAEWDYTTEQGMELLARHLPQTCFIIGWSLGGLVAQLYAKQYPRRVVKLMLIASAPRFTADTQWPHGMPKDIFTDFSRQYTKAPHHTLQKFCALQVLDTMPARQVLSQLTAALSNRQRHKIQWGLEWLRETDLRANQTLYSLPIELLHGEKDRVLSICAAEQTADTWQNTRLKRVANAGHAPFISHPDCFLRWVDDGIKHG